jgi:phosphoglycerate kinase
MSHLGRPEGKVVEELRLTKIAAHLEKLIKQPVKKLDECVGEQVQNAVEQMQEGEIIMLENVRFHDEEEKNDPKFIQQLAALGDIFVNDGFGVSHRSHASCYGISTVLPSYAGLLIEKEIKAMGGLLESREKPFTLILGGAKIKDKLGIIRNFMDRADYFLIGGGIANTFLYAKGMNVGASLCEKEMKETALDIMQKMEEKGKKFILPEDVVVATEMSNSAKADVIKAESVQNEMKIFDIGPETTKKYTDIIGQSKTIFWNGPMGLSEYTPFENGTREVAKAIASTQCTSVIGGGDSAEIIKKLGFTEEQFTHISTGGGASLEFLSGKQLPGLKNLEM